MKKKSPFTQAVIFVSLIFVGAILTLFVALLAGSIQEPLFDFKNLNLANMIPVFIFGGLFSGFAAVIALLFTSRTLWYKLKEFFNENEKNNK